MNKEERILIKDKFDTEAAQAIVDLGYPANEDYLNEMIFWSCFPNDPVARVLYPFLQEIENKNLTKPLAEFLQYYLMLQQEDLISTVFYIFINGRGKDFRQAVMEQAASVTVRDLFSNSEYSYEEYEKNK